MANIRTVKSFQQGSVHPAFLRKAEQREIQQPIRSSSTGYVTSVASTKTDAVLWKSSVATAGSATAWTTLFGAFYTPTPGFALVIRSITIIADTDCLLAYQQNMSYGLTPNNLYGNTGFVGAKETVKNQIKWQSNTTGGEVTWTFPEDDPLIIRSYEQLSFTYSRTNTTGVNAIISIDGVEVVEDFNYGAPLTMLVLGDSISGITNQLGLGEDGYWSHNIRNRYRALGKNIRLVNIGITGTTISDWDYLVRNGRLNGLQYDIAFVNCGMNDAAFLGAGGTALSSGGANSGTDGKFKTGFKNVITRLANSNKNLPIIINGVTPADLSGVVANLSNIRTEQQGIVTDMNSIGYNLRYVDPSNIYLASDKTNFIEQTVNTSLHPSSLGQTKLATQIWNTIGGLNLI